MATWLIYLLSILGTIFIGFPIGYIIVFMVMAVILRNED